jgi:hypothetical protein
MKKSEEVMREVFCRKAVLGGGIVVILALFAAAGAAAPAGKARVKRTVFNPITSKPVWVSNTKTRSDPMLVEVMQGLRVAGGNGDGPLVIVPARPHPRSPFVPPSGISLDDLPPWVQVGDP